MPICFSNLKGHNGLSPSICSTDNKAIAKVVDKKVKKYALIGDLVNLQSKSKTKVSKLKFVPAVVTHSGQLNYELFSFIENCTNRFKRLQKTTFDIDGRSLQ